MLFAHAVACLLVLAAKLEGLPDGSWMVVYGVHDPYFCTVSLFDI